MRGEGKRSMMEVVGAQDWVEAAKVQSHGRGAEEKWRRWSWQRRKVMAQNGDGMPLAVMVSEDAVFGNAGNSQITDRGCESFSDRRDLTESAAQVEEAIVRGREVVVDVPNSGADKLVMDGSDAVTQKRSDVVGESHLGMAPK